jgi:hypothetical protein
MNPGMTSFADEPVITNDVFFHTDVNAICYRICVEQALP